MLILFTIVHVLVCFFLVVVVLLQSGKAADLAGAFGGMGSQTAFGPRGAATALTRATTVAAALFMVTSLTLSIMSTRTGGGASSVLDKAKTPKTSAPVKPPVPGPGIPAAPGGPPTVTLTPEGGQGKTVPLPLPPAAQQGQQQQQQPAPAKK